jgi:hypothetical protein
MTHPAQIKAAEVYGQDRDLTDAEQAFLQALDQASRTFIRRMDNAALDWGGGSVAWQAVRNLAERSRDAAYTAALARFEDDAPDNRADARRAVA